MITELTQNNIEQILSQEDIPLVVEFSSPTCIHCKRIEPILNELSDELDVKAIIAKCNVMEEPDIADRYGITALPTLLFIKNGEIRNKLIGFTHKMIIEENIKKL